MNDGGEGSIGVGKIFGEWGRVLFRNIFGLGSSKGWGEVCRVSDTSKMRPYFSSRFMSVDFASTDQARIVARVVGGGQRTPAVPPPRLHHYNSGGKPYYPVLKATKAPPGP